MNRTDPESGAEKPVSPRRGARRLAVQMLYGWLLNPGTAEEVKAEARLDESYPKVDAALFERLIDGTVANADSLRETIVPFLDRPVAELSPVEHVILLLATEELAHHVETPYRVVISEAIELAKTFGGTDGHKFVNGVMDRIASQLRPHEAKGRR